MDNSNVSLVVEGGGFRAIFAAAAVDVLASHYIHPNRIATVSAGAAYSLSLLSQQSNRNPKTIAFVNNPNYCGLKYYFREGNFFNWNFAYKTIPTELLPLDYHKITEYPGLFEVAVTNCLTGKSEFLPIASADPDDVCRKLAATSALPFLSKPVMIDGTPYLDGGLSVSIPVDRIGDKPAIVVLTQPSGFVKKAVKPRWFVSWYYRNYPELVRTILNRHCMYNNTLAQIELLERQGKIFVIRPIKAIPIGRLENKPELLTAVYASSRKEIEGDFHALQTWLERQ